MDKDTPSVPQEVIEHFQRILAEQEYLKSIGIHINYVKPHVFQGKKMWALRNRLFETPTSVTFHEFIINHLQHEVLGKEWWDEQANAEPKHFIYKCFEKWNEWRQKNAIDGNREDATTWSAPPDGWAKTLISLAFDIATLEHTAQLPEHLLKRLKNHAEYQGAHYEIAVAAIFARLGCRIEFLDTQIQNAPHCEFIATHEATGTSIAVEAKSRQRPGVKHMPGASEPEKLLRVDVRRLLNDALKQNPKDRPYIVFIDINAPLTPGIPMPEKPWFKDIDKMLGDKHPPTPEKPEEFTAVIFTNFSPHYNEGSAADPNEYVATISQYAIHPLPNSLFGNMLILGVQNYGTVPNFQQNQ